VPSILIVDDDRAAQQMLLDVLEEEGYEVAGCRDGNEVMPALQRTTPDMLILDVLLPHINGFELIEKIRADARLAALPVLMISGIYRGRNHRDQVMQRFGVVDYIDKPLSTQKIVDAVRAAVGEPTPSDARNNETMMASMTSIARLAEHSADAPETPEEPEQGFSLPGAMEASQTTKQRLSQELRDLLDDDSRRERDSVEHDASSGFDASSVLQGFLNTHSIAGLFGRFWRQKSSGALLLRRGKTKKIVYIRDGSAYGAKSNRVSECLGQVLVRERLISEDQCAASIEKMRRTQQRQGEVLVEMGAITRRNLLFALELQLETKLFDVFSWTEGEYRFNAAADLPEVTQPLEWQGGALVIEGVRRGFDETRLFATLDPFHETAMHKPGGAIDVEALRLTHSERAVVNDLKLPRTVREIIDSSSADLLPTMQLLYGLIALQILQPVPS